MAALTIQDVSRRSGLSEPTLRYYEQVGLVIHNDRAKQELGLRPRPAETTIVETVESLRDLGLLKTYE